jgi:hypothetical protein
MQASTFAEEAGSEEILKQEEPRPEEPEMQQQPQPVAVAEPAPADRWQLPFEEDIDEHLLKLRSILKELDTQLPPEEPGQLATG